MALGSMTARLGRRSVSLVRTFSNDAYAGCAPVVGNMSLGIDVETKSLMAPPLVDFAAEGLNRELEDWCQRSNTLQPMDLDITDENGDTALIHCASLGSVREVQQTSAEGLPIEAALQQATLAQERCPAYLLECYLQCATSLLEYGAKVDTPGRNGSTALAWSGLVGFPPMLHMLLEAGAVVDHADDDGNSPSLLLPSLHIPCPSFLTPVLTQATQH